MSTHIHKSAGHVTATTVDRYENTQQYNFMMDRGIAVPVGDGRDYSITVLEAMWDKGIPVDWTPDELTATERKRLDAFCGECAERLTHEQVGPDEFETRCDHCDD